jgi:hypothetical protein
MKPFIFFKITFATLLALCLLKMPYGYYQFVRFVGMIGFLYLGLKGETREELRYFWLASAILINPIIKIPLGRDIWNAVDVIWTVVLLYTVKFDMNK